MESMTSESYYEITENLTTVRPQRFVDFLTGWNPTANAESVWEFLPTTGNIYKVNTDAGVDMGTSLGGTASNNNLIMSMDKDSQYTLGTTFNHLGSSCIWIARMREYGSGHQGGWGMCHKGNNVSVDAIKTNIPQSGYIGFYTASSSEGSTSTDTVRPVDESVDWKTYKFEQLNGRSNFYIDGILESTRTSLQPRYTLMPFAYAKYANHVVDVRYCEAWNH